MPGATDATMTALREALERAVARHRQGDSQGARQALEHALDLQAGHPDALHMLANLDGEAGRLEAAERYARDALKSRPVFPACLTTLSRIQAAAGRNDEALATLEEAITQEITAPRLNSLGLLQLAGGRLQEAGRAFERALEVDPAHVPARVNLGVTRFTAGQPREAARDLDRALAQVPGNAGVAHRLGLAWQACGEHERALAALEAALTGDEASAAALTAMGISLTALGRYGDAVGRFDAALAADPDCVDAIAGKAELLEWQGRYDEGVGLVEDALSRFPGEPALQVVYARLLRRLGRAGQGIALLEPLAVSGELSGAPLRQVRFTLGDLHDQLGRYDDAFSWYQRAHEFRPNAFSADAHRGFVTTLKLRFSRENIAHMHRARLETDQPVFVVGMPRSGTSLTEQVLAAHPDVYAAGERPDIGMIVSEIAGDANPSAETLTALARRYMREAGEDAGRAVRITDKMPLNFLYLGWIAQLFPGARVVYCQRDARDTGLSCYTTNFVDPALAFADRLEHIALYQRCCEALMAHWQDVLTLPILAFGYEQLVAEPEVSVRTLLDFLGLPWRDECLRFNELSRVVTTSSHAQVREPIHTRSVGRWRHYAEGLAPLITALEGDE